MAEKRSAVSLSRYNFVVRPRRQSLHESLFRFNDKLATVKINTLIPTHTVFSLLLKQLSKEGRISSFIKRWLLLVMEDIRILFRKINPSRNFLSCLIIMKISYREVMNQGPNSVFTDPIISFKRLLRFQAPKINSICIQMYLKLYKSCTVLVKVSRKVERQNFPTFRPR